VAQYGEKEPEPPGLDARVQAVIDAAEGFIALLDQWCVDYDTVVPGGFPVDMQGGSLLRELSEALEALGE
jgi:hypothetical protein